MIVSYDNCFFSGACSEKMELERKLGQSSTRVEAMVTEKKVMEANIASLEETQRNLKYVLRLLQG